MIHSDTSLAQTCWIERLVGSTVNSMLDHMPPPPLMQPCCLAYLGLRLQECKQRDAATARLYFITLPIPDRRCWDNLRVTVPWTLAARSPGPPPAANHAT